MMTIDDFVTCPSQKVRYASAKDAHRDIRTVMATWKRGKNKKPPAPRPHVYVCDRCGGWHLTTKYRR